MNQEKEFTEQNFIPGSRIELDPVSQTYAAMNNDTSPGTFRLSAHLKECINREILQKAVNDLIRRLPFLSGHLRRGFFRYHIKTHAYPPKIEPAKDFPSFGRCHKKGRDNLLRVYYGEKSITVETTHIVCDGRSLVKITTALLARYFELLGAPIDKSEIIDCTGTMQPEEIPDAFAKQVAAMSPKEAKDTFRRWAAEQNSGKYKPAYRFGNPQPANSRIVTGKFDATKIKSAAKEHGATVSEFILAHIFRAVAKERAGRGSIKPITVMLPVDFRAFFPVETLRNFVMGKIIIIPETDDFSEMLRQTKSQFEEIDATFSSDIIVGFTKFSEYMRFIPLPIKKMLMRLMKRLSAALLTSTFSNLGLVKLPPEIEKQVETLEFACCPETELYVFSCVTFGNTLVITASINVEDAEAPELLMRDLDFAHIDINNS
jgi:NRPS condensation-like uncharacterized protein